MGQLEDMQAFARIVESGGVGAAADSMGIARSAISRRLKDLEDRLGVQLVQRTTRSFKVTDAGQLYYQKTVDILDKILEASDQVASKEIKLSGILKVSLPQTFGLSAFPKIIHGFSEQHPSLRIHIDFTDRNVDIINEQVDLAIRIGKLSDSMLQARKLTRFDHYLVASPDYLKRKGYPLKATDLFHHDILEHASQALSLKKIFDQHGNEITIDAPYRYRANNGDFLLNMALEGQGIMVLPSFSAKEHLLSGKLVSVLDDYTVEGAEVHVIYSNNRFLPQRTRLLIDYLNEQIAT